MFNTDFKNIINKTVYKQNPLGCLNFLKEPAISKYSTFYLPADEGS
jgi:hypothetical protein